LIDNKKISAIILAAGSSSRFGKNDKLCMDLCGKPLLHYPVEAFCRCPEVDEVILVFPPHQLENGKGLFTKEDGLRFVAGGASRPVSSLNGIKAATGDIVLIHDGARPFISAEVISRCAHAAASYGAAAAGVPASDTIKICSDSGIVEETTRRTNTWHTQTPQCFDRKLILEAYEKTDLTDPDITDDCMIAERQGIEVRLVESERNNIKVTVKEDMVLAEAIAAQKGWGSRHRIFLTSIGQDSHRMAQEFAGRPLVLGGVEFAEYPALVANSDGDVVLHALTNAVSGITGKNVLGSRADEMCRSGITDSREYLKEALSDLQSTRIIHASFTIECKTPHLSGKIDRMKESIAGLLGISADHVGITATTGEGLTAFGRGEGIGVFCVLSAEKEEWM
jgi:2-C-methyl-D-erythritol 4-phosphate cytidylyltransferase/2-C-methyl-D-erythritol 2,4-cyclodiphosphate synthase